ncbi:MAG: ABC transporter permease [Clostridia bacterium]|nr:ABC transporter permease [Clostridia bacterium]
MRKYLFIFKAELMSALQYVANILLHMITYFIVIIIFFYLWNYIYDDPTQLINGYSKTQMIWYVIITEIIWNIVSGRKLCRRICDDVKSGNIAYNMNKPYNYIGYILSSHLGEGIIKSLIYITFGIILGRVFLGAFPTLNVLSIVLVILSLILAVVIDTLFIIFIGLFSLYIEDANPLFWLYSKLILILGTMFPIEFFPEVIQKITTVSPIYVICYGPAKLFVDFNLNNALNIIAFQFIYLAVAFGLCGVLYAKGVKKLNVNGG